jgi:hypothetical protein
MRMKEDKETQAAVKAAMTQHSKLVVGDDQTRQQEAMREIQNVLAKYNVSLVPRAMISPSGIEFMIETQCIPPDIMAKKEAEQAEKVAARKGGKKKKRKKKDK